MMKKIEPSEIGKNPDLIAKAQREMATSDVLVCGKCHSVFHFIDLFREHKTNNCKKISAFKDCRETRPKIWAYLLWKQTQFAQNQENAEENPWKLYQQWMSLDESIRQSWLVAGGTIQSFEKFGSGVLQETPVKITKTLTPEKPQIIARPSPMAQVVKRVAPGAPQQVRSSPNVIVTEQKVIRRADDGTLQEKIVMSPKKIRMINRTDPVSGNIERASIDKIMAKRMNPRKKENEYLVKWESKPQTWEPASHLDTCKDLIENFEVLLAKQKEMRAKTQLSQQQQAQPSATSTPTAVAQQISNPVAVSTPNRPERSSKAKAISQVKQWTGGNKSETDITAGKRKMEEEDDYEEMDGDDVDDEDYQLESSWEKKKMAQQLGQVGNKKLKTDTPGQNGAVRVVGGKQDIQIGATVVRKVIGTGTKSPDVVIAGQKQMSGVFKKATPGPATAIVKKPGEGQVRIVEKKDQIQSGIVRVGQTTTTTVATANVASPRQTIQSRVVPKPSPVVARQTGQTGNVVRSAQAVQAQQKTLAQKIMQRSPVNKGSPVVQRQSPANQSGVVVRRSGTVQTQVVRKTGTPVGTPQGKVLGQPEGEPEGTATEEQEVDADQHQITQLLSNEDGTPIYITGDDGTMYQVAGKNAKGETILVSTNAEGEQTCVLLPADQDLLAGLPGIQTSDVTEAAVEGTPLTVDAAVAEAVSAAEQTQDEAQFDEASQGSQGTEDATAPLSVAVGGESGDSQDGQITAEIVQADEPSPGGTRKVVLMLPDGNLMVTELSSEQFQSLNIQQ